MVSMDYRSGAVLGLIVGMIFVILAETFGHKITGNALPWGRWPLTIYSGLWGLFFNVIVCFSASIFSSNDKEREHRDQIHDFFSKSYGNSPLKKKNKIISICSFFTLGFFLDWPRFNFWKPYLWKF